MATKTKTFDTAAYLENDEDIAAYMTEALATGDAAVIAHALEIIIRTRGLGRIARESGLSREDLDRALSAEGTSEFATVLRIIDVIGLRLTARPTEAA